jgi:hypothetical protein
MKLDLHIHSNYSDGLMSLAEIFQKARQRKVQFLSITDHDSLDAQEEAKNLATKYNMAYIYGIELNVTFSDPAYQDGKAVSLDFLGYQYNINFQPLKQKLIALRAFREKRAEKILENINRELVKEDLKLLTPEDLENIQKTVDGAFGRPHIANYLVEKGLVVNKQNAFNKYLIKCNVPKMPLSLSEASELIRGAGGKLVFAHPNNPRGTSLAVLTTVLPEQQKIIKEAMLPYIDGIECWHSGHDKASTDSYRAFAKRMGLIVTGGSDCHQQPLILGSLDIPAYVAEQFGFKNH